VYVVFFLKKKEEKRKVITLKIEKIKILKVDLKKKFLSLYKIFFKYKKKIEIKRRTLFLKKKKKNDKLL
jgi:hypothetical protein